MGGFLSYLLLTPEAVGIEKLTVREIAEGMTPDQAGAEADYSSLSEFAETVKVLLEPHSVHIKNEEGEKK